MVFEGSMAKRQILSLMFAVSFNIWKSMGVKTLFPNFLRKNSDGIASLGVASITEGLH